jgi:hypothetical protein
MSMSRTSYLCVLVFVAGCNSFYGLDETRPNRDEDGDGVRDKEDNCPTIPNSFQTDSHDDDGGDACAQCPAPIGIDLDEDLYDDGCDRCLGPGHPRGEALIDVDHDTLDDRCDPCVDGASVTEIDFNENGIGDGCEVCFEPPIGDIDGDGLDDACDPCLKGPPHDEDRDGHHDACDNCPFDFNPGQVSTMGGVGDACDRATTVPLERAVFEPFLVRDLFRWNSIAGAWTIANDRASLTGTGQRRLAIGFRGQFRFVMRSRLQGGAGLRVEVRNATQMAECKITPAGHVTFGTDAADLAIDGPLTIEVYYSAADILPFMHCQVTSGSSMVVVNADPLPQIVRITLEGTEPVGTFEIESVDLLTTIPPPTAN